jgi:hypothetical protein
LGTAALLALPVFAAAQSSGSGSQTSQTPTTQSDSRYPSTAGAATQHLTEAGQVLDGIARNAVTGPNAAKLNKIRKEFAALKRSYEANPSPAPTSTSSARAKGTAGHWNTQLMALDRDLTALLGASGSSSATGATGSSSTQPEAPAGTSGSTAGSSQPGSASSSTALDPNVRSQLEEFRTHITKFAAAASGTEAGGEMSSASTSSTGSTSPTSPTSTTPTEETTTSQSAPPTSAAPSSQTGSATGEAAQTQPQTSTPGATGTSGTTSTQADAAAARQHLTEARQSLADMTALPQAQQLQGEARTQVSQLISQFNQLITTEGNWKASYDQVNATLTTLLSSAPSSASSSTTSGAVGTTGSASASGTVTIDPAIRGKLEEFRTHLQAFFAAAGGDAAGSASSTGSASSPSSSSSSMSSTGSSSMSSAGSTSAPSAASDEIESHIAAIEQILNQAGAASSASSSSTGSTSSTSSATGTSGSTNPAAASGSSVTLTPQQIEQIRTHLQQLRSSIKK